jgi:murein L,D-transpeptidase YafK
MTLRLKIALPLTFLMQILVVSKSIAQENFYPVNLLKTDDKYTHHVLVVEKSTHKLLLYRNVQGIPQKVTEYQIATGKNPGNKGFEGDKKTPEGVYELTRFHDSKELLRQYGDYGKIYGAGAFVLNYPNVIDRRLGKTGGGIWLHSTDDESRISKGLDSRGCVVVNDNNLRDVAKYIDLDARTTIVTVETLEFWKQSTWEKNRDKINQMLMTWLKNWNDLNINAYLSHYNREEFRDENNKNFRHWNEHKTRIFANSKMVNVNMENLSYIWHQGLVYVNFDQKFSSSLKSDVGRKKLILKQNDAYEWKIISESWEELRITRDLAFTPSQRFFK